MMDGMVLPENQVIPMQSIAAGTLGFGRKYFRHLQSGWHLGAFRAACTFRNGSARGRRKQKMGIRSGQFKGFGTDSAGGTRLSWCRTESWVERQH
jgi:hypothetical protein